jgi:hypothetical protein
VKERATGEPSAIAPTQREFARAEIDKVLGAGVLFD